MNNLRLSALRPLPFMVLCVMTIVMAFPKNVRATCVPAIENVSVSASKSKCGFINSCQSGPPVYYLINTYVQSVSATELSANCANNPPITAQQKYNLTEQEVQTMNPMTCTAALTGRAQLNFHRKERYIITVTVVPSRPQEFGMPAAARPILLELCCSIVWRSVVYHPKAPTSATRVPMDLQLRVHFLIPLAVAAVEIVPHPATWPTAR